MTFGDICETHSTRQLLPKRALRKPAGDYKPSMKLGGRYVEIGVERTHPQIENRGWILFPMSHQVSCTISSVPCSPIIRMVCI